MTKQEEIIRLANYKGYYVDDNGKTFNSSGVELLLNKNNKGTGYLSFNIRVNGSKPTRCYIHKLQAFQIYGDSIFMDDIVVRHKNGNSTDNSKLNILIGSQLDNMNDIPKEKRIINASNPKYNHELIIKDRFEGMSYKEIMDKHNIKSKGTISFIMKKSLKIKNN